MPLTFPRDMISGRKWVRARFWLNRRQEMSRNAGGAPIVADLGPPLWRADFESDPLVIADADALLADFDSLGGSLRSFYAYPFGRPRPAADSGTSSLSGITVRAVSADRQRIGLDGLPAGLELTTGDYVSVSTAAGGLEFYQFAEGGTADSGGSAPMLTVTQPIRPAVAVDDSADLTNPRIEMVLEPGTLARTMVSHPRYSVTFQAWQVVR